MKKIFKSSKGFAMAELLSVAIVVLLIFSVLFSNYLPLVAEYENRLSYNDVTSQYAAHYIRKLYKDALSENEGLSDIISPDKMTNKFVLVYDKSKNNKNIFTHVCSNDSCKNKLGKILNEYGVEEIIITNYSLTGVKYEKSDGLLYDYIKYLPEFKNTIYKKGTDAGELYRLILKTDNYGYATTPIIADYTIPSECFDFRKESGGLVITNYHFESDVCPVNIVIDNRVVNSKVGTGRIVGIADGAFLQKPVETVNLANSFIEYIGNNAFKNSSLKEMSLPDRDSLVVKIGNSAFEGSNLENFDFSKAVINVGDRAFANIKIKALEDIPLGSNKYGDEAFADNRLLDTIKFNSNISGAFVKDDGNVATGLFSNCGNESGGIEINIPSGLTKIGAEMFKDSKLNSIKLSNSTGLVSIGDRAFMQTGGNVLTSTDIVLPENLETIGESSFEKLGITNLSLTLDSSLSSIGTRAFVNNKILSLDFSNSVKLKSIGVQAFQNNALNGSLDFSKANLLNFILDEAFSNNKIPSVIFDNELLKIGSGAFKDNKIQSLDLSNMDNLSELNGNAFKNNEITDLKFSVNSKYDIIGSSCFENNKISSLNVPEKIKIIDEYAFKDNPVEDVKLHSGLVKIRTSAFENTEISNITIPNTVTTISQSAFNNSNLSEVVFEKNGVEPLEIYAFAFASNSMLKTFDVPSRTTRISDSVFYNSASTIYNYSTSIGSNWCSRFIGDSKFTCSMSGPDDDNKLTLKIVNTRDGAETTKYVYLRGGE